MLYVLFRMPSDIYLIFPIVGFLGALIGLSILAAKSELIAMRASGFSVGQMARAMMMTGGALLAVYYALSLFVAPYARHMAYYEQSTSGRGDNVLVLSSQTWLKSGNHFLLMGQILPEGIIHHVTDFVIENGALTEIREIGQIVLEADHSWLLTDVVVTHLTLQGVTQTVIPSLTETSLISRSLLPIIAMQPDEMDIYTLSRYIHFRQENKLDVKQYNLQFWNRLIAPLMLPIMMLLAIPFVLGSIRTSTQIRLVVGLVVGFSFYIISQFFGSLTLLSPLAPFWGAAVPPLVFGLFAWILFYIVNRS
jgi:lipopolysaccharide export system permease protein